jgi:hypothetical protein
MAQITTATNFGKRLVTIIAQLCPLAMPYSAVAMPACPQPRSKPPIKSLSDKLATVARILQSGRGANHDGA